MESRSYSNHQAGHDGEPVFLQPQSHTYGYDPNGNLVEVKEQKRYNTGKAITQVTAQSFDPLNRLESKTNFDGKKISYTYDKHGNRASVTDSEGLTTIYRYDSRERIEGMTLSGASSMTTYAYYPDGLLKKVSFPNGTFEDMDFPNAYDRAGRLTRMINHAGDPTDPISQYAYHYDANGNRDYQDEQHKGLGDTAPVRTVYSYDLLDRLINVDYGSGAAVAYTYAPNGNRLTEVGFAPGGLKTVSRAYEYDRLNRLVAVKDHIDHAASVLYEFDPNGNTISRNIGTIDAVTGTISDTSGKQLFDYDLRDKLSLVTSGGASIADFDYDYTGLRIKKTGVGYADVFLYDQRSVLQEYDSLTLATKRKYNYGTSLHSLEAGGKSNFYLLDGLKSTSEITDDSATIVASYQYDAWGGSRRESGTLSNDRRFTGHYLDKETGLHYFGARYYDDKTGRFLTQDPYLGDMTYPPSLHRYMYANNNPLFFTDPTGFVGEAGYMTMKSLFGLDSNSVQKDLANESYGKLFFKETAYDILNVISLGYEKRQDARVEKYQSGEITEDDLLAGSGIDAATSAVAVIASGGVGQLASKAVGTGILGSMASGAAAGGFYSATEQSGQVITNLVTEGRLGQSSLDGWEIAKNAAIGGAVAGAFRGAAWADDVMSELKTVRMATPELPGGMKMAPLENVQISTLGAVKRGFQRLSMMSRIEGGAYNWQRASNFERGLEEIPGALTVMGNKWNGSYGFNPAELNAAGIISKPGMYARIWGTRAKALAQNLLTKRATSPHLADNLGSLKGDFDVMSDAPALQKLDRKGFSLRDKYAGRTNETTGEDLLDVVTSPENPFHAAPAHHGVLPTKIQPTGPENFIARGNSPSNFNWTTEELYRWGNLTTKKSAWIGAREVINFKKASTFK